MTIEELEEKLIDQLVHNRVLDRKEIARIMRLWMKAYYDSIYEAWLQSQAEQERARRDSEGVETG